MQALSDNNNNNNNNNNPGRAKNPTPSTTAPTKLQPEQQPTSHQHTRASIYDANLRQRVSLCCSEHFELQNRDPQRVHVYSPW